MTLNPLRALLLAGSVLAAQSTAAQTVDVNLNDETIRGEFQAQLSSIGARFNAGVLRGEDDFLQGHAGLLVTGDAGAREANVIAGLGGRVLLMDAGEVDGGGLALGGQVIARLPAFNRIGAVTYAYWAPGASAFGDLEDHFEYAVALDYEVIRNASIYVGYRQVRLSLEQGPRVTADTGFHFGMRLHF